MAQTPNSSTISYLSVDEFILRKDVRDLGMLAVDDGTVLTPTQLQTNQRVAAILLAASGEVEAALLASERYATADLSAPNGASAEYLKSVVADVAMYKLFLARNAPEPPPTVLAAYDEAKGKLDALANGTRILSFAETEAAGVPEDVFMQPEDFKKLNRFSDSCARALGLRNDVRKFH